MTWDWTQVSRAIGKPSTHWGNEPVLILNALSLSQSRYSLLISKSKSKRAHISNLYNKVVAILTSWD